MASPQVERYRRCAVNSEHEVGGAIHAEANQVEAVKLNASVGGKSCGGIGVGEFVECHADDDGGAAVGFLLLGGIKTLQHVDELVVAALCGRAVVFGAFEQVGVGCCSFIHERFKQGGVAGGGGDVDGIGAISLALSEVYASFFQPGVWVGGLAVFAVFMLHPTSYYGAEVFHVAGACFAHRVRVETWPCPACSVKQVIKFAPDSILFVCADLAGFISGLLLVAPGVFFGLLMGSACGFVACCGSGVRVCSIFCRS